MSSLVAYLSVAGIALWLAHRTLRRISILPAIFLAALPALFLGEAFAKNGVYAPLDITYRWEPLAAERENFGIAKQRTPLLVDVVDQHIPWRKAVRVAVKNHQWPLWNRFELAGEPLLAFQMPQVLFPGGWLGFGLPLANAWTFDMGLRLFLALLGAYLLLRDMECSEIASCFGATAWALCDFLIFSIGYPHGPAAGLLPLLVMGLRRIALSNGARGAGLSIMATALIISAGHPETSLHAIAIGGAFFLVVLAQQPKGRRVPAIRKALLAGVLGTALMGVTLVPFLEVLPDTFEFALRTHGFAEARKSLSISEALVNLETQVVPYSQGVSGRSFLSTHNEAAAYAGSLVLVLVAVGLGRRNKDRLPLILVGTVGTLVAMGFPGLADIVGRLPLFNIAINQRLVFAGAFSAAILAGVGLDALLRDGKWRSAAIAAFAVGAVILGVWIERRPEMLRLKMAPHYMESRLALELLPILGLAFVALHPPSRRLLTRQLWLLPFLLAAIRYPEIGRLYPVAPARAFYPPLDVLKPIERGRPYRFAAFGLTFIPNMSALYELEDVRGYEAMTLRRLVETYSLWCVPQPVWFNRIDDPTKPFLNFLNVRFLLVPNDYGTPPRWKPVAEGPTMRLLENELVLPRAFAPRRILCARDSETQLAALGSIRDFASEGVAEIPCAAPSWSDNGHATVEILDYRGDALSLAVEADAGTVLATSIPAWPGWRVQIDGNPSKSIFYNHAFIGVQVPSGRHVVTLRYRPLGAAIGGAITAMAAAGIIASAAIQRRRRRLELRDVQSAGAGR